MFWARSWVWLCWRQWEVVQGCHWDWGNRLEVWEMENGRTAVNQKEEKKSYLHHRAVDTLHRAGIIDHEMKTFWLWHGGMEKKKVCKKKSVWSLTWIFKRNICCLCFIVFIYGCFFPLTYRMTTYSENEDFILPKATVPCAPHVSFVIPAVGHRRGGAEWEFIYCFFISLKCGDTHGTHRPPFLLVNHQHNRAQKASTSPVCHAVSHLQVQK